MMPSPTSWTVWILRNLRNVMANAISLNCLAVLLSVLTSASLAQPAAAEARKQVAVLSLESDMVTDDVAKGLRQAICDALTARADWEVHETQVSLAQLGFAHDCTPTEPACLRAITEQFQLDSLVYGRIARKGDEIVVHLSRFEPHAGAVERSADATFSQTSVTPDTLGWQGRALTSELFDAGTLTVADLDPEDADFGSVESPRVVALKPAADSGVSSRTVAGYALLGAAAVSTGLSVFSFVQIQNAQDDQGFNTYRRAVGRMQPAVQDVCAEVDSGKRYGVSGADFERSTISCNRGQTYQLLQFVFLGSALVTGGVGAYLLLDDRSERARPQQNRPQAVQIQPRFSRTSAELSAQFRF